MAWLFGQQKCWPSPCTVVSTHLTTPPTKAVFTLFLENDNDREKHHTENPKGESLGAFSMTKLLNLPYEKAKPHLTDTELKFVSDAVDYVTLESGGMASIAEVIGCAVASDDDRESGSQCGSIQGNAPAFIWHVGRNYDLLDWLAFIGGEAGFKLQERKGGAV
jgi:hypothetical protein